MRRVGTSRTLTSHSPCPKCSNENLSQQLVCIHHLAAGMTLDLLALARHLLQLLDFKAVRFLLPLALGARAGQVALVLQSGQWNDGSYAVLVDSLLVLPPVSLVSRCPAGAGVAGGSGGGDPSCAKVACRLCCRRTPRMSLCALCE